MVQEPPLFKEYLHGTCLSDISICFARHLKDNQLLSENWPEQAL